MRLQPREFAPVLDLRARGRRAGARARRGGADRAWSTAPSARTALRSTRPCGSSAASRRVVPAKPGVSYEPADVSAAFLDLVVPARRRARGEGQGHRGRSRSSRPRTPASCRSRERVSTFTTYYPYAEYRNINIGRAAELVNGTILKPGETFSLNEHRRRAHPRERLHRGLHHQRRHLQGGPRRRRLPDGDDDLQRDVLRRAQGRRAQAALVLHRPLPGRPRGDRRLGRGRPALPERHALRRADLPPTSRRAPRPARAS